jgi:hypothetical protein
MTPEEVQARLSKPPEAPQQRPPRAPEATERQPERRHFAPPSARERALMRRRLRALIQERELRLRDLGGLTMEMHRRNAFREDLLRAKADEAAELDAEIRLLRRGLREQRGLAELGIDGSRPQQ